jgi:RNA recognition motif-containing protein
MDRVDCEDRGLEVNQLNHRTSSDLSEEVQNTDGCFLPDSDPHEVSHEAYVKLFVGSLPYDINEEDIMDVFTEFGEVLELCILRDRMGRSKGCAALRYATKKAADLCISTLHNRFCCGNVPTPMQVRYFEKRDPGVTTCCIEGLSFCFPLNVLWSSFTSNYGPVSNVYPDAMNPFAVYVSFLRKSSAFAMRDDALNGAICIGGIMCPGVQVTILKQPIVSPYGYFPQYPAPTITSCHQTQVINQQSLDDPLSEDGPAKLFVGCLPYSKTAQDIADLFSQFGDLLEVAILTDYSGKSRGAAFVTFAKSSDAKKAVSELRDFSFPKSTRNINISFAHKQNIWHTQFRSSESGTAPSCTSSVTGETASPISTEKGFGELNSL